MDGWGTETTQKRKNGWVMSTWEGGRMGKRRETEMVSGKKDG